jgi:hypothetical protein
VRFLGKGCRFLENARFLGCCNGTEGVLSCDILNVTLTVESWELAANRIDCYRDTEYSALEGIE